MPFKHMIEERDTMEKEHALSITQHTTTMHKHLDKLFDFICKHQDASCLPLCRQSKKMPMEYDWLNESPLPYPTQEYPLEDFLGCPGSPAHLFGSWVDNFTVWPLNSSPAFELRFSDHGAGDHGDAASQDDSVHALTVKDPTSPSPGPYYPDNQLGLQDSPDLCQTLKIYGVG